MVEVTETFLLSALTIGSGIIMGVVGVCYKSKCSRLKCCCIDIERNVIVEEHEDLAKTRGNDSPKINTNSL